MQTAILLTATYLLLAAGGSYFYLSVSPMLLGPVVGLLLGDLRTGIIMGGSIEAIYLGVMNVGGTLSADKNVAAIVATAFVIKSGADISTGLAIAYPLGIIAGQLYTLTTPFFSAFDIFYDKLIYGNKGDMKKFAIAHHASLWTYELISNVIVIFLALSVGADAFGALLDKIPANVMAGLNAAGNMMVAVGLGLTLQLIWRKEIGAFFFIGYFLASLFGMNSVQIALVGIAFAVLYYSLLAKNNSPATSAADSTETANTDTADDGGDFFA